MVEAAQTTTESVGVLTRLGVDWRLLLAQLVNFSLVALAVWRWVYRPLLKAMDERTKKIERGLKDADAAASAKTDAERERAAIIAEARREAARIREEAEHAATTHRDAQIAKTKSDVESLVMHGKEQLEMEKQRTMRDAKSELAGLVVHAVERIAGEKLDAKKDEALIRKAIEGV
jgi:F-type H+-transporting ATPase subunit b